MHEDESSVQDMQINIKVVCIRFGVRYDCECANLSLRNLAISGSGQYLASMLVFILEQNRRVKRSLVASA